MAALRPFRRRAQRQAAEVDYTIRRPLHEQVMSQRDLAHLGGLVISTPAYFDNHQSAISKMASNVSALPCSAAANRN